MKRSDRRHLKENALGTVLVSLENRFRGHGRALIFCGLVVLVGFVVIVKYLDLQNEKEFAGTQMLAEAMITATAPIVLPPDTSSADGSGALSAPASFQPGSYTSGVRRAKVALQQFIETADAHPANRVGLVARYYAATTASSLGQREEAIQHYQMVIESEGNGIYGEMAQLGMAEAQMHSGNYAEATEIFEASSKQVEWDIPVDGVLFELGKTYLLSGQSDQAQATFTRIIAEFPESLFQTDAQAELDKLGSSENE
ncbi:MAG TPA: hypothetical protein DD460_12470 [Acidobacteria bacterium]|jgi:TolA-binding protein|nr:hypothetical protein [Acidobacteriota bacterium]|tara:strand:- start:697 stop:1464 length:768 start_codon:yes stop_codon:yes gene_type:complete